MTATTSRWTITPGAGWDGLHWEESVPAPDPPSPDQCLLEITAVSLNYRDTALLHGNYPQMKRSGIVPCSDAVGRVIQVGDGVTGFKIGDRVCTVFNPAHDKGAITHAKMAFSLGNVVDGTLRKLANFDQKGLVKAPSHMTDRQAATLTCAGVTAYNSLFGLAGAALEPGQWVLTQGTGGVSLFAIQMAVAHGANAIATTSSDEKAEKLKQMGVKHVIDYAKNVNWGELARKITPDGEGVHHVVEVGGDSTMTQSLEAVRPEGLISLVGFLGGNDETIKARFMDVLKQRAIVRGMSVGSAVLFRECVEFMEKHEIEPTVDGKEFAFKEADEAMKYFSGSRSVFGKVVITVQ